MKYRFWTVPLKVFLIPLNIIFPRDKRGRQYRLFILKRGASVFLALSAFIIVMLIFPHLHLELHLGDGLNALFGLFSPFSAMLVTLILVAELIEHVYGQMVAPIAQAISDGNLSPLLEAEYSKKLVEYIRGLDSRDKLIELKKGLTISVEENYLTIKSS